MAQATRLRRQPEGHWSQKLTRADENFESAVYSLQGILGPFIKTLHGISGEGALGLAATEFVARTSTLDADNIHSVTVSKNEKGGYQSKAQTNSGEIVSVDINPQGTNISFEGKEKKFDIIKNKNEKGFLLCCSNESEFYQMAPA